MKTRPPSLSFKKKKRQKVERDEGERGGKKKNSSIRGIHRVSASAQGSGLTDSA
uniref:Uncharacterized protein n=1 Tax=Anguilla anguilla TaxID=7936 RepID=A0A0E9QJX1_ANGAN